jgi:N-methylhydantoinase A
VRLNKAAAERAIATLGGGGDIAAMAAGIIQVASAVMARALKRVSVTRGIDPRGMALLPFGGAGPLFGCALADTLGMSRVVIPPHPGVLSALGLAAAPERVDMIASLHRPLAELEGAELRRAFEPLLAAGAAALSNAALTRLADCRFAGQGYEITVPAPGDDPAAVASAFLTVHHARHGHADESQPIELVNLRVVAERPVPPPALGGRAGIGTPSGKRRTIVARNGKQVHADVWPLGELPPGRRLNGPAVLAGPDATGLIEAGWRGTVHDSGAVTVERA